MPVMGVPLMVVVGAVLGATEFAVAVAGLTLTASPPPQAVRPNKTSANAQTALISLKSCTPRGVSSPGRAGGPRRPERESTTEGQQSNAHLGKWDCASDNPCGTLQTLCQEINYFLFQRVRSKSSERMEPRPAASVA
jgi:hypothetical protein